LVRDLSKNGVFIEAGSTFVTPIGPPLALELHAQGLDEALDAVLGGAVRTLQRDRAPGEYGGDVHQRPAALALQVWQRGHRPVDLPHEVDLTTRLNSSGVISSRGGKERDGGEVHPSVEPTVLLDGFVRDRLHLIELSDVGHLRYRLAALAAYFVHEGAQPDSPRADTTTFAPLVRTEGPPGALCRSKHPPPLRPAALQA
jgi:hypothetical protein